MPNSGGWSGELSENVAVVHAISCAAATRQEHRRDAYSTLVCAQPQQGQTTIGSNMSDGFEWHSHLIADFTGPRAESSNFFLPKP
jgi:hypothetical protein